MKVSKYAAIGRDGTPEQFLQAVKDLLGADKYGWSSPFEKKEALVKGAAEAFQADHPENIQRLFQEAKSIRIGKLYESTYRIVSRSYSFYSYFLASALDGMSKDSADKGAAIDLALADVNERHRQELLSHALEYAVNEMPPAFVKLLHESGASFDDARVAMKDRGCDKDSLDKLEFYRVSLTGAPAAAEIGSDVVQELREQMRELTEKVDRLLSLVEAANANQPAEPKAAPVKKPYIRMPGL